MITLEVSISFCSTLEHTKYNLWKISLNRSAGFFYIKYWKRREGITFFWVCFFPFVSSFGSDLCHRNTHIINLLDLYYFRNFYALIVEDWSKEMHLEIFGHFFTSALREVCLLGKTSDIWWSACQVCSLSDLLINFYCKLIMIISSCQLRQSRVLQEEPFSRNYLGKFLENYLESLFIHPGVC